MISTLTVIIVIGCKAGECMSSQDIRKFDKFISDNVLIQQDLKPCLYRYQMPELYSLSSFIEILEVFGGGD